MAKRPRYPRGRRVPGTFRFGEQKGPDPNLEPQRLTLYLTGALLDTAEALAAQAGCETVQEYCTALIQQVIETERVRAQVASIEAQHGVLDGLREIADDPEYLVEWSAQSRSQARDRLEPEPAQDEMPADPAAASRLEPATLPADVIPEPGSDHDPQDTSTSTPVAPAAGLSPSAEAVLRHAAQAGENGSSFLACLRRGEAVPLAEVADLARALHALELETRDATVIDRRLAYALYRLAFESQVLHTDAWPGAFDEWTVDTLRAVQEAVDRILSGQDIRYGPPGPRLEIPH